MKQEVILKPALGIEWMQATILLDEKRERLNTVQMPEENVGKSLYYADYDIRVDFDEAGKVEFIEIRGGHDSSLCPVFNSLPLFEMEVAEVLKALEENYVVEERENGHSYIIPELELALWRERTEADVDGFIADMKADGIAVEGNEDIELERRMARYFESAAIGRKGYFTL